jgi:geranylgeranyl pyrophosphate synthase
MSAQEQFQEILETHGGATANISIQRLLKDPQLMNLQPFTEFVSKSWRDPFIPAMMSLGCQAVNGNPKATEEIAAAMSLMNLSFRLWDDVIDDTPKVAFRETFVGKFGKNAALIYGGTVSAKAFTILNEANINLSEKETINRLIWNYWAKMAKAELEDLTARYTQYNAKEKLKKIKDESINIQTCLKIGATLGKGSNRDTQRLARYGECLAIMLELLKDVKVSLNLTLELEKKIATGQLPYLVLLVKEETEINKEIEYLSKNAPSSSKDIESLIDLFLTSKSWVQYTNFFKETSEKCRGVLPPDGNNATKTLISIAINRLKAFEEITKMKY